MIVLGLAKLSKARHKLLYMSTQTNGWEEVAIIRDRKFSSRQEIVSSERGGNSRASAWRNSIYLSISSHGASRRGWSRAERAYYDSYGCEVRMAAQTTPPTEVPVKKVPLSAEQRQWLEKALAAVSEERI